MKNYKTLAVKYLKKNKKRSMVTIFGVAVSVCVLFLILNLVWSLILNMRQSAREEHDYEIVLLTETQDQIEHILQDERVKSAYIGSYYDGREDETYHNVLFINTTSPYRMNRIMKQMQETYGVEGRFHDDVASSYLQGDEPDLFVITVLGVLLVSYIFAILGVGIVRNSIQLTIHEQMKDFGNLRCIGGSKKQLKAVIYMEGALLESIGIVIGVLVGIIVSVIVGGIIGIDAGFHWISLVPIVICYYGDLCFAMNDNCKLVTKMSPVSAVRGEFRIRKEKIKIRKSGIFGKIFGVEGDYAYKNIRRNPRRFWKTVASVVFGVAAMMTITSIIEMMNRFIEDQEKANGYYQIYYEANGDLTHSREQLQAALPSQGLITELANIKGVGEPQKMYSSTIYLAGETPYAKMTDEYRKSDKGIWLQDWIEKFENRKETDDYSAVENELYHFDIYGYEKEDYERNKDNLIAGTLDVSEKGIILVNNTYLENTRNDGRTIINTDIDIPVTNYKIGDEIKIVNITELKKRVQDDFRAWKEEQRAKDEKDRATAWEAYSEVGDITNKCWHQLIEEGQYESYIIEGILSHNANHGTNEINFVLPLDKYYKVTGLEEGDYSGIQFHISSRELDDEAGMSFLVSDELYDYSTEELDWSNDTLGFSNYIMLFWPEYMLNMVLTKMDIDTVKGFGMVALFLVILCSCNIVNNISGSLYLRRKEFAQLRVIGVSKKRLMKMVMLEGVITTIIANFFGVLIGAFFSYIGFWFYTEGYGMQVRYHFPMVSALLGIAISLILLCGTSYISIHGMKQNMADDLAASGE